MFCSVIFRKTSMSLMTAYLAIMILFCVPLSLTFFVKVFVDPEVIVAESNDNLSRGLVTRDENSIGNWIHRVAISSPFAAAFSVPLNIDPQDEAARGDDRPPFFPHSWAFVAGFFGWFIVFNGTLMVLMIWLFNTRWRVSQ
jgi:hypothetical protein